MRHYFIINPVAGKGQFKDKLSAKINELSEKSAARIDQYFTTCIGDATRFVKEVCSTVDEPVRFYACGGDGTFQETVIGTLGFSHAQATVIPCGSGNDFVKSFADPEDFKDLEEQLRGETMACDIIKINNKYALNLANVGFDSDIAMDMTKFKKVPFLSGSAAYDIALIYNLLKKLGKRLTLTIDNGHPFEVNTLLAAAANGRFYGGGYQAAPLASMNDGILDLCYVDKLSRFKIAGLVRFYKRGEHLTVEGLKKVVHYHKCKTLRITSKKALWYVLDGEPYQTDDAKISIIKDAFTLSLPKSCIIGRLNPERELSLGAVQ